MATYLLTNFADFNLLSKQLQRYGKIMPIYDYFISVKMATTT